MMNVSELKRIMNLSEHDIKVKKGNNVSGNLESILKQKGVLPKSIYLARQKTIYGSSWIKFQCYCLIQSCNVAFDIGIFKQHISDCDTGKRKAAVCKIAYINETHCIHPNGLQYNSIKNINNPDKYVTQLGTYLFTCFIYVYYMFTICLLYVYYMFICLIRFN